MMVLLGYFFIAAMAGVAASSIIGFVLTNVLINRFEKVERPIRILSNRRQQSFPSGVPFGFRNSVCLQWCDSRACQLP
jgi:hypothetical protein